MDFGTERNYGKMNENDAKERAESAKNTLDASAIEHQEKSCFHPYMIESIHWPCLFPSVLVEAARVYRFLTPVNIREEMTSAYTQSQPPRENGLWTQSTTTTVYCCIRHSTSRGVPLIIAFNRSGHRAASWPTDRNHLYATDRGQ